MPPNVKTRAQDDDFVMSLVDLALAEPAVERKLYVQKACSGDPELFRLVWGYVEWEERMGGFLLEPLFLPADGEHPFEVGNLLDNRFRIEREIAQGGMGVVYEAWDEKLKLRIAVKCAKAGYGQRLPPEVRHAREISHPNVCKLFEIHTAETASGEADFVTMEYVDGETLAARLKRGAPALAEALSIARQICAGLTAAHARGVIHGDLKSQNVILAKTADGTPRAVITDFGMARERESSQSTMQTGPRGGTPNYMAPELWQGEKATMASDVYALGVVLHEVLGGCKPASGKVLVASPKWNAVISKCLAPDPAKRYASGADVARAFEPSRTRWHVPVAAAAAVLAAITVVTYERATAPKETIRLAVLPFATGADTAGVAAILFKDTVTAASRLRGGPRAKLSVISAPEIAKKHLDSADRARSAAGATHVVRAAVVRRDGKIAVQANLTDARSGANQKEWEIEYAPKDLRFAPVALAGMVTETLHLPPLAPADVNAAARKDYSDGLAALRWYSGVDVALYLLGRAATADPDSPLTHAGLAEAEWLKYALTKDKVWLERSSSSVRAAQQRNPDVAPVHAIAGLLETNSGSYEQAIQEYRRAVELNPSNSDAFRRLGSVLETNNQLAEALPALKKAVEVDPAYFKPYQSLVAFYERRGNYVAALVAARKMAEFASSLPESHFALGSAYERLGQYAEAERELRVSIAIQDTPRADHELGYTLMEQGKDLEAIPAYLRALSRGPDDDYLVWLNLGISYHHSGQIEKAQGAFRRGLGFAEEAVERDPRAGLPRAYFGYLLARLGDAVRAESEEAQAVRFSPNDQFARITAAKTYEVLGRRESTIALLSSTPEDLLPGVLAHLNRYPDVADLRKDARFLQLLASYHVQ